MGTELEKKDVFIKLSLSIFVDLSFSKLYLMSHWSFMIEGFKIIGQNPKWSCICEDNTELYGKMSSTHESSQCFPKVTSLEPSAVTNTKVSVPFS